MFIQKTYCISSQKTFSDIDLNTLNLPLDNIFYAAEPKYEGIPLNILRRMGKAVRLGIGTALPIINYNHGINGIIIGTANGGMEDCIKFLNQIIQYEEGRLTPTNFVQSTLNSIATQIGLATRNNAYNITHVHRGLAFENALIDASMMLAAKEQSSYLVGGVDEISSYHYSIEKLGGWFRKERISGNDLYESNLPGCIAGEGAAMFLVNNIKEGAMAKIVAVKTLHTEDGAEVTQQLKLFLKLHLPENGLPDVFLSGENGDCRLKHFSQSCEEIFGENISVARFKHFCGEFPTASAIGLWLACRMLHSGEVPLHMMKHQFPEKSFHNILMYNNYKGMQHCFILISID